MRHPELRGRLQLWNGALIECELLLGDAGRALGARDATPSPPSPLAADWHEVHQRFTALAIVFFAQIFNLGFKAEDIAAGNLAAAVNDERERIIAACFPTLAERAVFDALLASILKARDKVLAHADGGSFDIDHSPFTVMSDAHYECLKRIDIGAWRRAIPKLRHEVEQRMKTLGVGATIVSRSGA